MDTRQRQRVNDNTSKLPGPVSVIMLIEKWGDVRGFQFEAIWRPISVVSTVSWSIFSNLQAMTQVLSRKTAVILKNLRCCESKNNKEFDHLKKEATTVCRERV